MGLFSFLNSTKPNYKDKVWKASEFCLKGMMTDALQAIREGNIAVVASHFSDRHERIIQFLTSNAVPCFLIEPGTPLGPESLQVVYVLNPRSLQSGEAVEFLQKLASTKSTSLLVFGHYPFLSKEEKFLKRISSAAHITTTFYSSIDEPSFEIFGSAQMISLMDKMGLKDEEAIEHAMVSKSMIRARQKMEEKAKFDREASSEKEWFEKNLKS